MNHIESNSSSMDIESKTLFDDYIDVLSKEMMSGKKYVSYEMFWKPKKRFWERKLALIRVQIVRKYSKEDSAEVKKKKKKIEIEDEENEEYDDNESIEEYKDKRDKIRSSNLNNLKNSHKAVDNDGINQLRREKVKEIEEILSITSYAAQALLAFFAWDKERLLEAYIENPEEVCKKSGVPYPPPSTDVQTEKQESEPEDFECPVCYMESNEWTLSPHCGHKFCDSCWSYNLELQITEGHAIDIHCMQSGCTTLISEDVIQKLVNDTLYEKYCKFLSQSFVDTNKGLKWCPARNCGKIIYEKIYEGGHPVGKCSCGNIFCFSCMEKAHTPCSCSDFVDWKKKTDDNAINAKWLSENTKPCPGCKTHIEKNDGCFAMTCSKCRYMFCWLCLSNWNTHSNHFKCSKFGNTTVTNKPMYMDDNKPEIAEYQTVDTHYYVRYQEYNRALELESENWKKTIATINEIKTNYSSVDPSFLVEAHKQLQRCRRILTFTFAHLGMHNDPIIQSFCEPLEMVVEKLAQQTERVPSFHELDRSNVRKLTKIAKKTLENFLEDEAVVRLFK